MKSYHRGLFIDSRFSMTELNELLYWNKDISNRKTDDLNALHEWYARGFKRLGRYILCAYHTGMVLTGQFKTMSDRNCCDNDRKEMVTNFFS